MTHENLGLATRLLHENVERTAYGETSESLFLTSGFIYDNAEQAEDTFLERSTHFQYSRMANPTTDALQNRLASLEGADACVVTSSGMGAVSSALLSHLKSGDRIVASRALFGSNLWIIRTLLPRYGIETVLVDGDDWRAWEAALSSPASAVFIETPSNPMLDVIDIARLARLAHGADAVLMVDNVFASPIGQKPLAHGADIVLYSCTKHIDGQGRVLGGAILGGKEWIDGVARPFVRNTGNCLSTFNAWVLLKGLETLALRVQKMSENAQKIARFLDAEHALIKVCYPGLPSHPHHDIAKRQMTDGGSLVTFDVKGGKSAAYRFLNALKIIAISNNLGDARSLATHPATTTHMRLTPDERAHLRISDGAIRLSVGLEDPADLINDLATALKAVKA